jgi:hypothetical protein
MSLPDRRPRRDADHDVGEVPTRGLAEPKPPKLDRGIDAGDRLPSRRVGFVRRPVHQHVGVRADQPRRRHQHQHGDEQRGERVRARVAGRHETEAEEHRERARKIAREVQCVRLERRAAVAPSALERHPRPARVDGDHDPDHEEGVPGRLHVGLRRPDEVRRGPVGDEEAGEDEDRRLGERRQMLRPPVAVRVARVGRPAGDAHCEEGQQRGDEIRARVDRLGDETEAAARQPGAELQTDQDERSDDGDQSGSPLRGHRNAAFAAR